MNNKPSTKITRVLTWRFVVLSAAPLLVFLAIYDLLIAPMTAAPAATNKMVNFGLVGLAILAGSFAAAWGAARGRKFTNSIYALCAILQDSFNGKSTLHVPYTGDNGPTGYFARLLVEIQGVVDSRAALLQAMGTGLAKLAEGDLTYRIVGDFSAPPYGVLPENFNLAMKRLEEAMKVIAINAQEFCMGTEEISVSADDLSRRTEQQAASLEETAAALDQITVGVRLTAEKTKQTSTIVHAAKNEAEQSGLIVHNAITAMGEIAQSSKKISQIIGTIDEIAFLTNLLALNAGVEAARAGEAGKGFAVVAGEVRTLAQRSTEAAKEIKALISTSSSQVEAGVQLVSKTGSALEQFISKIGEITTLVADISSTAHGQSSALNEVNSAINQMDHVTQQNAAMVEENTAASHALTAEGRSVTQLIAGFKIGLDDVKKIPRKSERPVRNLASTKPKRAEYRTHGNAALAQQTDDPRQESWEEF